MNNTIKLGGVNWIAMSNVISSYWMVFLSSFSIGGKKIAIISTGTSFDVS